MLRKEGVKHAERVYMSVRWQDDATDTKLENERVRRSWERSLDAYKLDPARAAHAQGATDIQDLSAGFVLSTWPAAVPPAKTNASPALAGAERDTIVAALRKHHWQVLASAKALGGWHGPLCTAKWNATELCRRTNWDPKIFYAEALHSDVSWY